MFTIGLGSSPRTEGLGGRPGGCGGEEQQCVWVSKGIRTASVARMSLRGRRELALSPCIWNPQVIMDDLHLKEGAAQSRKSLCFYLPLPGFLYCPHYSLPSSFFLPPSKDMVTELLNWSTFDHISA